MKLSETERKMVENLDKVLKKIPRYEGNLSRSLYFGNEEAVSKFMINFKIGETVSFNEFISTTSSSELYNPIGEIQIYIQNARNGRDLTTLNTSEMEVLYERNSTFDVLKVAKQDGKYFVLLEESI